MEYEMSKRAAIYARVSSDPQRDNYSISTQIAAILAYAKKGNYTIVGNQYVDPNTGNDVLSDIGGIPAFVDDYTSLEISRPGLDAGLRYLESSGFDVLLVHSLDRMARDPYIRETLKREFEKRGAVVEYVLGNYEDSAEGEVRKDLDATFAKWENAKRVERSNRGKRGKAEAGKFVAGRPPYGYKFDKDAPSGLVVNEKEATVVRWIFNAYVNENLSIRGITESLNEQGITPRMGGDEWQKSSVSNILRNSVYVGYYYYNKSKRISRNIKVMRDRDEWIKIETIPLFDKWVFQTANSKLAENKQIRKNKSKRFYLLTGMVFCAECERPFVTQTALAGKNRRVNEAQSYRHRAKAGHCSNRQISARILEPIIWNKIKEFLLDPVTLIKGYSESLEQQEAAKSRKITHHETLQKKLKKFEQERANLNNAYLDPDIGLTKTEYLEQKRRISDEISELKQKIEQSENDLSRIPTPEALQSLEDFAGKVRKRLFANIEPRPEDKRKLFEMLHIRVFIGLDWQIKIKGWFGKESVGLTTNAF
jgi:site-specific DNA recombinase